MIVEIPIEHPARVIPSLNIPESARAYCDIWGNIKKEPIEVIEENHGPNFIRVLIFAVNDRFFYGYQLKLSKIILQKQANINDKPEETKNNAKLAARDELINVAKEKNINDIFIMFDKICYNQPELF